jgi:hypothetical protein
VITYNTPELLLIGAAQNLVLGSLAPSNNPECDEDSQFGPHSDLAELW